jgi:type I restriction enzyme R subunit
VYENSPKDIMLFSKETKCPGFMVMVHGVFIKPTSINGSKARKMTMAEANQNPEQKARDKIDFWLEQAGWKVQDSDKHDFNAGPGIALREYSTKVGPADYKLFVNKEAVGVIEAKREESGHNITLTEEQSKYYADAQPKRGKGNGPKKRFLYETNGVIVRFTDRQDPNHRSREVFNFHQPETIKEWLSKSSSLRKRL